MTCAVFSVDGWGCVPSLLFGLRPNYGRGYGNLLKKDLCQHTMPPRIPIFSVPDPTTGHCGVMSLLETPGHSQENLAQSLVGTLLLSHDSWYVQGFVCALQESVSLVLWKFCSQISLASKMKNVAAKFPAGSQILCQIPKLRNLLGSRTFLSVQ